ncbi:hypothetical protein Cal7507_1238 [Calothrix sp. PCC 7507]|nr:hypothetical protein Cal7507_1238 [Calothrix sp. PCC 7507]
MRYFILNKSSKDTTFTLLITSIPLSLNLALLNPNHGKVTNTYLNWLNKRICKRWDRY